MQKVAVSLLVVGLLAVAGLLFAPDLFRSDAAPTLTWQEQDEIPVATAEPTEAATAEVDLADPMREAVATDEASPEERTPLLLRGRVVDSFRRPVAAASVWLDFGRGGGFDRGGRQRRVPDPVQSDAEGRFAFQGQTFRNLRVTLLIAHRDHAPTWFERNLGEVQQEMDLGELQVAVGGELIGRVTDLDGNGIPRAAVQLQPENDNRMRFRREQDLLLPVNADHNGYYRLAHVAAGNWRLGATAKQHENGTSDLVPVADGQRIEVADIRLGPGYELTGIVSDVHGVPVADADVTASARFDAQNAEGERRGGRGGRSARGGAQVGMGQSGPFGSNDHRTKTNAQGRFVLEHLPGSPLDLTVRKEGHLDFRQSGLDAKSTQPIYITLQDGLVILGMVADASGVPVTTFRVTAERRGGLRQQGGDAAGWDTAMLRQWREGEVDQAVRETLRERIGGGRRDGGEPGGAGGRGGRERKFEQHAEGRFREASLQEGTYVVVVESPAFAVWRSSELELRLGVPAPDLKVTLDPGFSVRGHVRDSAGLPLANARVELRLAETADANSAINAGTRGGGPGRGGRGGRGPDLRQLFASGGAAVVTATTDRLGQFALEHATAGRYRVVANSRGHDEARTEPFDLAAPRTGVDLTLGTLGKLAGRVVGGDKEQLGQARVVAVPVGEGSDLGAVFRGNNRMFGEVQHDGTYRFDELSPGSYCVRAFLGNGMRELFEQFTAGEMFADVVVKAGETAHLDVTLMVPQSGTVLGSVLHNGSPASGFHVSLRRADDSGGTAGGGFGGGRRGGGGREFSAVVDTQGRFEVRDVPAGNWQLAVSGDRRSGALHSQSVTVHVQTAAEVTISVTTAALDGQVQIGDDTPSDEVDGSVTLLPGITEMPQDMAELRRNAATLRGRVQDGRFTLEMVPPGNYLAILSIRGRERSSAPVFAALGQRSSVTLPLGAKSAAPTAPAPGRSGSGSGAGGGTEPGAPVPGRRGRRGQ